MHKRRKVRKGLVELTLKKVCSLARQTGRRGSTGEGHRSKGQN
jgi:hypothetical protein